MHKSEPEISQKDLFEFSVCPRDEIIVHRQFFGKTKRDIEIENIEIPKNPLWLRITIKMIRFYQIKISKKLGNRCVFDPSCSHYAEIAYRKKGFIKGTIYTIKRLSKCRPINGGIDEF